jgi:hypothetical protein
MVIAKTAGTPHTGWGRAVVKGPTHAPPFYTANYRTHHKSDSCSKFRTNPTPVARTLLSGGL